MGVWKLKRTVKMDKKQVSLPLATKFLPYSVVWGYSIQETDSCPSTDPQGLIGHQTARQMWDTSNAAGTGTLASIYQDLLHTCRRHGIIMLCD